MAYSYIHPAFLLAIFLTSQALSPAASSLRPPLRIKLHLTRLDMPPAGKFSVSYLQQAFRRTSLPSTRFQYLLQRLYGGAAASLSDIPPYRSPLASELATYTTPVFPDANDAAFLTTLSIGTPPVSFNAIVDTGSDLVWLQCKPCNSCFTNQGDNTILDPSLSSSYSVVPCTDAFCNDLPKHACSSTATCAYNYTYGDASFTAGELSKETLTLPNAEGGRQGVGGVRFGCGHDNQLTVRGSATDGIVGLGQGPLSLSSQLGVSYLSYCLQSTSTRTTLYLGDSAEAPPSSSGRTLTTPFFKNPKSPNVPYYYVQLNGISVAGKLVPASSNGAFNLQSDGLGGMIFDSGTTLTLLLSNIYTAVVDAFKSAIPLPPTTTTSPILCYNSTSTSSIQLPSLTFHFAGADLQLPLDNYFIAANQNTLICLALLPSNLRLSIFGNVQQANFFITYNLQAHTLSLTPTTCGS